MSCRQGRARRSRAAPQAGKASSRCLDFRIRASGWRYSRWIDRTRCAREIAAHARRFPCRGSTACFEGPLATHPDPAGAIPNRGLRSRTGGNRVVTGIRRLAWALSLTLLATSVSALPHQAETTVCETRPNLSVTRMTFGPFEIGGAEYTAVLATAKVAGIESGSRASAGATSDDTLARICVFDGTGRTVWQRAFDRQADANVPPIVFRAPAALASFWRQRPFLPIASRRVRLSFWLPGTGLWTQ